MKDEEQQSLFGSGSVVDLDHANKFEVPTVDVAPVVKCKDCILHGSCTFEDTFRTVKVEDRFCCVGKRRTNNETL